MSIIIFSYFFTFFIFYFCGFKLLILFVKRYTIILFIQKNSFKGSQMVTIKTIAQRANVSPSTVSIILNGKEKERKISPETVQKVRRIIADSGYKPNVQAANLRASRNHSDYRILIFWIADSRAESMIRFFKSIEAEIMVQNYSCEILLKSYKAGQLESAMTEELILSGHGIIICNATERDMEYLDSASFPRPVVLYNRYSAKYTTVTMDDRTIGTIPAQVLVSHGLKKPAIITSPVTFNGMTLRINLFSYTCVENGMQEPWIYYTDNSKRGGYEATLRLLEEHSDVDSVFFLGDTLALGALRAFYETGILIPEQVKLISVGNNVLDQCEVCLPSISVIYLPIEDMAVECLHRLYHLMSYQENAIRSISLPVTFIARESCPFKQN